MKKINNWWFPDVDEVCWRVTLDESGDLELIKPYLRGNEVAIQAGGNVGIWAKRLSKQFQAVYTWEPDPDNFECLMYNAPERNIVKFNCALGNEREMVNVGSPNKDHDNNCGAYQVIGNGIHPTMRIDDMDLPACDFIQLDIEGYEFFAIKGAWSTITKYRPVIMIEDKELPNMYGHQVGDTPVYICETFGYEVVERIHRDIIMAPR